jgi:hypothetical protein
MNGRVAAVLGVGPDGLLEPLSADVGGVPARGSVKAQGVVVAASVVRVLLAPRAVGSSDTATAAHRTGILASALVVGFGGAACGGGHFAYVGFASRSLNKCLILPWLSDLVAT